jgi:hypothetical protein
MRLFKRPGGDAQRGPQKRTKSEARAKKTRLLKGRGSEEKIDFRFTPVAQKGSQMRTRPVWGFKFPRAWESKHAGA